MFRSDRLPAPVHTIDFEAGEHVYRKDGVRKPHITGIIDEWGFGFPVDLVDPEVLAAVRDRGKYVHACSELIHVKDFDLERCHAPWRGYCQALESAYRELALDALLVEAPLYDPQYDFAGTNDFVGYAHRLGKWPYHIELKTGDYTGVDAQMGAQRRLLQVNYPALVVKPENCLVLHLGKTGSYKLEATDAAGGFHDFAAMRRLTARRDREGRRA